MAIPVLPESAPFSAGQRAWLNGFFAGVFGLDHGGNGAATNGWPGNGAVRVLAAANGAGAAPAAPAAPPPAEEEFPWHDPALPMNERMRLAEDKPYPRQLMAAMA